MKDINDPNVLKEYIGYLAELAESVLTHINITDNDYQSLFVESESLCKRVAESNKIPPSLKSELGKLKLPKIKGEFTFWSFLKMH